MKIILLVNVLYTAQLIITLKYSTVPSFQKIYLRQKIYTEFCIKRHGISRNSAELKLLPHKIPYSAEFQKVTSVDTLAA
jgi:hypothetical protein